jgi:uncharacterized protein (DUF885 family)
MDAKRQLDRFVDEYFKFEHRARPLEATFKGIHAYDHLMGEFDAASLADEFQRIKEFEARFERIPRGQLDLQRQNDCLLLEAKFAGEHLSFEHLKWFQNNPATYIELCLYGLFVLMIRQFAPLEQRLESLLGRLREIPRVLDQARENLLNPPKIFTQVAMQMVEGSEQFFGVLIPQMAEKAPRIKDHVLRANAQAKEAFGLMLVFLKESLLHRSTGQFAIGEELFNFKLCREHLLSYRADDLLRIGQEHLGKTQGQLAELAKEVDPRKGWPQVIDDLKRDHPSKAGLLDFYREMMQETKTFVRERGIVDIPEDEILEIIETPQFQQGSIPYAAYLPPAPYDEDQRGFFYVTPVNEKFDAQRQEEQLRGHCRYKIPITALHEGYPGHHLQLVWANRVQSRVRREFGLSSLFAEGWALYCEVMMRDEGFYGDQRTLLFQLKDHLWRCARVVIDVSLHAKGMSFAEAVDFLIREAHLERTNARAEVRRYTMHPTQPMSYLMGKLEILRIRDRYQSLQGDAYNLREFHNKLLSVGTVPPKIAELEMLS